MITVLLVIWCLWSIFSGKFAFSRRYGVKAPLAYAWGGATLVAVILLGTVVPQTDIEIYDEISANLEFTTIVKPTMSILIFTAVLQFAVVFAGPFLAVAIHGNELREQVPSKDQSREDSESKKSEPPVVTSELADLDHLKLAIGLDKNDYYLRQFQKFSSDRGFISWNWPAFFVPSFWMLYRKMWLHGAITISLLPIMWLLVQIGELVSAVMEYDDDLLTWFIMLSFLVYSVVRFIAIPLFADALYYRVVTNRVEKAKKLALEPERHSQVLASQGGVSIGSAFIAPLAFLVLWIILGGLAALSI